MTLDSTLLDRLRARSEEVMMQVSAELMSNPRFMKAMEGALRGKAMVEEAVAQALKKANIPTRTEFKRALKRIEALEEEVSALEAKARTGSAGARRASKASGKKKASGAAKKTSKKASKKAKKAR